MRNPSASAELIKEEECQGDNADGMEPGKRSKSSSQRSFGGEISDENVGKRVLRSVSTIVAFIESQRAAAGPGGH